MKILVTYASRHGATQGIAERIADTLERDGLEVSIHPVDQAADVDEYDAFVIGSAAYYGRWLKEARGFVRRNVEVLAGRPVWLFSSGPIGSETLNKDGTDPLKAAEPKEFAEFERELPARDQEVFYGAWDPDLKPGSILERLTRLLPAVRDALPAGDFRDWPTIEGWAHGIARELKEARDLEFAHG
jgi:menaquinone-dependent protoporphyrinogen oxidase